MASPATGPAALDRWFERRSYDHARFADLDRLARAKRELGLSVTVVLPAREVAGTVGAIVDEIRALGERAPLVDELLVIDADSSDGTAAVAARHGADVYSESELLPQVGPVLGKGDAMWRSLAVAGGDLVMFLDSDTTDFGAQFVYGLLGPLLEAPELRFVKAAYSRPACDGAPIELEGSGRVTELTARPLLNLFFPELTGFAQPLAGEVGARRELLRTIPFFTGYAVEAGMLIDVLGAVGLDAMAQVDLGTRTNRNQGLHALSRMAYEVLRAVEQRLREQGRLRDGERTSEQGRLPDTGPAREPGRAAGNGRLAEPAGAREYVQAIRSSESLSLRRTSVPVVERPPISELL